MKKQNFLKGSLILILSAVAAKALGALFKIPLTDMLGGVGMSYFSCAYSIFLPVYALTVTGLSSAAARMTAKSAALGMYANVRRIRRTALLLFSAAGLAGSALVCALAVPFSRFSGCGREAVPAVLIIAPSVFFGCVTSAERGYYEGLSNMYPTAFSQTIEGAVKAAAGLLLCGYVNANGSRIIAHFPTITDVRALSAAAGILGVTLSSFGAMLFFGVLAVFNKPHKNVENLLMERREIVRELTATALPAGLSAVVSDLTGMIDMWTIMRLVQYSAMSRALPADIAEGDVPNFVYGSYAGIALTVFNLVPSVTNMLGKGALPCVTSAWTEKNGSALESATMQALLTSAVMSVPAAIGLGVLAPEILGILFPHQPDEVQVCVRALRLLMAGMVCLCGTFPLFSMLQAVGKSSAPLVIMLAGAGIKLAGNLVLVPIIGADGAAVSTSVSYGAVLVTALAVYLGATGIKLKAAPFAGVVYAGAMCGGAAYLSVSICGQSGLGKAASTVAAIAAGGMMYIVSLSLLSIKKEKRKQTAKPQNWDSKGSATL